jgi:ABC-type amino acid transport substrate-binding protein
MRAIILILLFCINSVCFSQTLRIGILKFNPPFEVQSGPNDYFGFDVDIIAEVCKRINLECELVSMPFSKLFDALAANRIDAAVGAIVISEERQKTFLFTTPYLPSSGQVLSKKSDNILRYKDLRGKKIGTLNASTYMIAAENIYKDEIKLVTYDLIQDLIQALNKDEVDAIVWDKYAINYWLSTNTKEFILVGSPFETGSGYGIAFHKGQETLVQQVNAALNAMENDGTFLKLYRKYLLSL